MFGLLSVFKDVIPFYGAELRALAALTPLLPREVSRFAPGAAGNCQHLCCFAGRRLQPLWVFHRCAASHEASGPSAPALGGSHSLFHVPCIAEGRA